MGRGSKEATSRACIPLHLGSDWKGDDHQKTSMVRVAVAAGSRETTSGRGLWRAVFRIAMCLPPSQPSTSCTTSGDATLECTTHATNHTWHTLYIQSLVGMCFCVADPMPSSGSHAGVKTPGPRPGPRVGKVWRGRQRAFRVRLSQMAEMQPFQTCPNGKDLLAQKGAGGPRPGTHSGSLGGGFSCFRCVTDLGRAVFGLDCLPICPEPLRNVEGNARPLEPLLTIPALSPLLAWAFPMLP